MSFHVLVTWYKIWAEWEKTLKLFQILFSKSLKWYQNGNGLALWFCHCWLANCRRWPPRNFTANSGLGAPRWVWPSPSGLKSKSSVMHPHTLLPSACVDLTCRRNAVAPPSSSLSVPSGFTPAPVWLQLSHLRRGLKSSPSLFGFLFL